MEGGNVRSTREGKLDDKSLFAAAARADELMGAADHLEQMGEIEVCKIQYVCF